MTEEKPRKPSQNKTAFPQSGTSRAPSVKRSVTIRPDIDTAVLHTVGAGAYSRFVNEALTMALQAQGIHEIVTTFEQKHGPLTKEDFIEVEERRIEAKLRREKRAKQ